MLPKPSSSGLIGALVTYPRSLRDPRVNRSDGLVQANGPARLTTHGHDGDRNMKVPWWVDGGGGSLELAGTRLDAVGTFRQEFPMALSPKGVHPSIVDIPAAGCWLLRLRTGQRAGVIVVRAVDARARVGGDRG